MNKFIQKVFLELENEKAELILILSNFNNERLNTPPSAGKWSPLQVVYHLIQAETISFKYIEKRVLIADSLKIPGINQRIFAFFVIQALKLPLKFKAPESVLIVPEVSSLNELEIKWTEARVKMKGILAEISDQNIKKSIYVHPVAGPMNMIDAMLFLKQHFKRHKRQISRCLR